MDSFNDPETSAVTKEVKKELFDPSSLGLKLGEITGFSPKEIKSTYVQACQQLQGGQVKAAAKLFGILCALEHSEGKNWRGLGLCMQRMSFFPVAEFLYNRALHLDPDDVVSRVFLAETLLKLRRYGAARTQCEQAIEDAKRLKKPEHAPYVKRGEKLMSFIGAANSSEQVFER